MATIIFSIWFFLPAGAANAAPIIASKLPYLSKWNTPIDFGKTWRSKRILGDNKTWRGIVTGIMTAIVVVYLQQLIANNNDLKFLDQSSRVYLDYSPVILGILFGVGSLGGDAVKSFLKRLRNVPPGESWFPYDQIDYIIGGCLAVSLVGLLTPLEYVGIIVTWFILHIFFSYVGYKLHLKPKPI